MKPNYAILKCLRFSCQFSSCRRSFQYGSKIRNIGIIAHIDAGKTTTTERMLYYSGYTSKIGDVDDGSTITDFLPAERKRGITIQSAAITFFWPPKDSTQNTDYRSSTSHQINLIDTPGHADFTFEVQRSLRVLDGAICILDGVAGVEAQTEQVWKQANEWNIPKLIYINKMERDGAAFGRNILEIAARLHIWPAVCQLPWYDQKDQFQGVVDIVSLYGLKYIQGDGKSIQRFTIEDLRQIDPQLAKETERARIALIELLSEYDDNLVEKFLQLDGNHLAISPMDILDSLRRILLSGFPIVPVFAGASFRNIGVQPLLDAINNLLPNPEDNDDFGLTSRKPMSITEFKACALAFKVVNDPRKGVLVYIRVYHGIIHRNDILFNTNLQVNEKFTNLLQMFASESVSIQSIEAGQIGVLTNTKSIRTGDTLISQGKSRDFQLPSINVPPPVFFTSIEPYSLKDEKDMYEKLELLLREDPSLNINQNEDTGQVLLSGMGELHLEIARDRLVNDFKAKIKTGKIDIGYRETITQNSTSTKLYDRSGAKAGCTSTIFPGGKNNVDVKLDFPVDMLPSHLNSSEIQQACKNGVLAALGRGPTYSFPMYDVGVELELTKDHILNETTYSTLTSAARLATIEALRKTSSFLMEPIMDVDITVDEEDFGNVSQDITSRGGQIVSIENFQKEEMNLSKVYHPPDILYRDQSIQSRMISRIIKARVPLKEMIGYLKHLKSLTGGKGTFVMNVYNFERVKGQREKALITDLKGDF